MKDAGFIIGAYVLAMGSMAAAAAIVLTRARRLARHVDDEDKPWP